MMTFRVALAVTCLTFGLASVAAGIPTSQDADAFTCDELTKAVLDAYEQRIRDHQAVGGFRFSCNDACIEAAVQHSNVARGSDILAILPETCTASASLSP